MVTLFPRRFAVLGAWLVLVTLSSCGEEDHSAELPTLGVPALAGLPAWETEGERAASQKADEFDELRLSSPQLFGVTAPPARQVRPVAEYERARVLMMRPSSKISEFHRQIIRAALGHVETIVLFHRAGEAEEMASSLESIAKGGDGFLLQDVGDTDSIWTRDYGPISVLTEAGEVGWVDFRYYRNRINDDAIPSITAADWGLNLFRPSLSLEGGNLMVDTGGRCFLTDKVFKQNSGHTTDEVKLWLNQYLGCREVITVAVPEGLGTGHIDMFAKLMGEGKLLLGQYDDRESTAVNAGILDDNGEIFASHGLEVMRLPLPWDDSGVWYTYTNSLILNDRVLIPVFSRFKEEEASALEAYRMVRPDLEQVTINSDAIIGSGGAIHCVTMTVPDRRIAPFQAEPPLLCDYNELNKCPGVEDNCFSTPGDGFCNGNHLTFCGEDGYPHAFDCVGCCGFGSMGWNTCLEDDCSARECTSSMSGCDVSGAFMWSCEESAEVYTPCASGLCLESYGCLEGSIACDDQCLIPGSRRCYLGGTQVCTPGSDGCRIWKTMESCLEPQVCFDGVCTPRPEQSDDVGTWISEEYVVVTGASDGCCSSSTNSSSTHVFWIFGVVLVVLSTFRKSQGA